MSVVPDPVLVGRLRAAGCVFAEEEAALLAGAASSATALEALLARRTAGEPLEHLLGWVSFAGHRITVAPGVFVPRQRTAFLARLAVGLARSAASRTGRAPVVLDLCCGSGALAVVVGAAVPGVDLHAADVDPAAVACARTNLASPVYEGDLFAPLPAGLRGRVDVLMANVPYVPHDEIPRMPPEARDHEPRTALDGGPDGLSVARRVAAGAPAWLAPGGTLLIEAAPAQTARARADFTAAGLRARIEQDDDLAATVVLGTHPR